MEPDRGELARRREEAAARYRPAEIDLLLVAEAPPSSFDRYFYFEDVREQDSLLRYVTRGVLHVEPTRVNKAELLHRLKEAGVFLIDLKTEPVIGGKRDDLASHVPNLVARCRELTPRKVILVKANVYDVAFPALRDAGLPVVDVRIPFPGSGQQRKFEQQFAIALEASPTAR